MSRCLFRGSRFTVYMRKSKIARRCCCMFCTRTLVCIVLTVPVVCCWSHHFPTASVHGPTFADQPSSARADCRQNSMDASSMTMLDRRKCSSHFEIMMKQDCMLKHHPCTKADFELRHSSIMLLAGTDSRELCLVASNRTAHLST